MKEFPAGMTKPTDKPAEESKQLEIAEAIKSLDYGEVTVIVNAGKVLEVRTTTKRRYPM